MKVEGLGEEARVKTEKFLVGTGLWGALKGLNLCWELGFGKGIPQGVGARYRGENHG